MGTSYQVNEASERKCRDTIGRERDTTCTSFEFTPKKTHKTQGEITCVAVVPGVDSFKSQKLTASADLRIQECKWKLPYCTMYRVAQLDLTTEIELFCIVFDRSFSISIIASLKQHNTSISCVPYVSERGLEGLRDTTLSFPF